ncbi:MAG: Stalked cell differentiation-controlling protein [Candidatus Accumulibacter phosphatis]|uniref:diguanylate cyclase n=1 Tax=Candidatus Accumulibacter phosphatis TaxID=327160 RepID=A0A080M2R2_9PROT|nr:sensor domain-containing diguanylate cyclase [Accumulibacter sp.]KFB71474.1 MAG: Stalked cell differentiation-controlling protein [Candidatus Accumulibacter phosphatis]MBL8408680.1 sensor domain-containing diguanylate cyclase [Accumulibacter sp.]
MFSSPHLLPPVDLRADDVEIGNYAILLDSLDIALLIFSPDGSLHLLNTQAATLLGDTPVVWEDENGQPLADDHRLEMQVAQTRQAVLHRAIGIRKAASGATTWCKASAFPVFADDGSLRLVLLALAKLTPYSHLAIENRPMPTHDPLSGIFNQRYIRLLLDDEDRRARRYGTPFALALMSIDNLTDFCAANGREAGERILAEVGSLLARSLRGFDMVGRFGSDQFLLILPNVCIHDAMIGLERVREEVVATYSRDVKPPLTISGGVSEYSGEDSAALIEHLRPLLSAAQEAGGNRLCMDPEIF